MKVFSFAEHLAMWEEVEVRQGRMWFSGRPSKVCPLGGCEGGSPLFLGVELIAD